jgi:hypothetical protein
MGRDLSTLPPFLFTSLVGEIIIALEDSSKNRRARTCRFTGRKERCYCIRHFRDRRRQDAEPEAADDEEFDFRAMTL